jgi:hypothetical protein
MTGAFRHPPLMKNDLLRSSSRLSLLGGLALVSCTLAAACQGTEQHELGYTQADRDLRGRARAEPTAPFFTGSDDFIGRWIGTAEDPLAFGGADGTYTFPSGSDRFTLDISVAFSEEYQQDLLDTRITFGAGEPIAPPTDPNVGYPVGVSYLDLLSYDDEFRLVGTNPDFRLPPFEGFTYQANPLTGIGQNGINLPDGLLILAFSTLELIDPWCRLQTSFEIAPGVFQCQEQFGGGYEQNPDGTGASCTLQGPYDDSACPEDPADPAYPGCIDFGEPVATANCDKLFMCTSDFCQCDSLGCFGPFADSGQNQLVLRRDGDELVGVFVGTTFLNARNLNTPLGEVRFQRTD